MTETDVKRAAPPDYPYALEGSVTLVCPGCGVMVNRCIYGCDRCVETYVDYSQLICGDAYVSGERTKIAAYFRKFPVPYALPRPESRGYAGGCASTSAVQGYSGTVSSHSKAFKYADPPNYPYVADSASPTPVVCPGCGHKTENKVMCNRCWVCMEHEDLNFARNVHAEMQAANVSSARNSTAYWFYARKPLRHSLSRPRANGGSGMLERMIETISVPTSPSVTKSTGIQPLKGDVTRAEPQPSSTTQPTLANMIFGLMAGGATATVVAAASKVVADCTRDTTVTAWQLFCTDPEVVGFASCKAEIPGGLLNMVESQTISRYNDILQRIWLRDENGWRTKWQKIVNDATTLRISATAIEPKME
jgi:hypothetical protein